MTSDRDVRHFRRSAAAAAGLARSPESETPTCSNADTERPAWAALAIRAKPAVSDTPTWAIRAALAARSRLPWTCAKGVGGGLSMRVPQSKQRPVATVDRVLFRQRHFANGLYGVGVIFRVWLAFVIAAAMRIRPDDEQVQG